jgi:lysophospholipase L1-like esterase
MRSRTFLLLAMLLASLAANAAAPSQPDPKYAIPQTDDGLPGAGPIRRYDWFRSLWLQKRSTWATRVAQDQKALVFLGDSITQGWGDEMGKSFPETKVANRGISGDTTRGVLIRLQEDVLALNPTGIVLLIGTNDLEEGADPETIAANLKLLLATFEKHDPKMPVILCSVFPSSETKKRPSEKIKKINQLYAAAVKGNPRVVLIDTWSLFADGKGDAKPEEFPDLLHPNPAGYAKWAAALRPVLATLGFVEKTPDDFQVEAGFKSLFNGKDLTGWGYPPTSEADKKSARDWQAKDPNAAAWPVVTEPVRFDGLRSTPEGRYVAINGKLVITTPPEGRKIQQLSTVEEFGSDFVLKLEFRATPNADSGIFIRGQQLQCRDYLLAGPYKSLKAYKPQDWNEVVIEVKGTVARCTCNGEVLEEAFKVPASGSIGFEGDRGQMEYRRIRLKPL